MTVELQSTGHLRAGDQVVHPVEGPQERALPTARRPDQGGDAAGVNFEGDALDRRRPRVAHREIVRCEDDLVGRAGRRFGVVFDHDVVAILRRLGVGRRGGVCETSLRVAERQRGHRVTLFGCGHIDLSGATTGNSRSQHRGWPPRSPSAPASAHRRDGTRPRRKVAVTSP